MCTNDLAERHRLVEAMKMGPAVVIPMVALGVKDVVLLMVAL